MSESDEQSRHWLRARMAHGWHTDGTWIEQLFEDRMRCTSKVCRINLSENFQMHRVVQTTLGKRALSGGYPFVYSQFRRFRWQAWFGLEWLEVSRGKGGSDTSPAR